MKSALIALCLVSVLGCASSYQVKMTQSVVPVDRGGRSPALATTQYNKVLIIPPAGTTREQHEALITRFETGFLKQGLSLIASARGQAARAAAEANLEKAIQMLQESGAEAVLKIVESKWSDGNEASRFFVLDDLDQQKFREVNENEYRLWNAEKYAFDSPRLHNFSKWPIGVMMGREPPSSTGEGGWLSQPGGHGDHEGTLLRAARESVRGPEVAGEGR